MTKDELLFDVINYNSGLTHIVHNAGLNLVP